MAIARDHHGSDCINLDLSVAVNREDVSNLHFKEETLSLAKSRRFANFEAVEGDDTRNAGSNIGDAGEKDEGILDIACSRNEGVGNEDEDDGEQANGSSYALHKHQSSDLILCKGFFLLHFDQWLFCIGACVERKSSRLVDIEFPQGLA